MTRAAFIRSLGLLAVAPVLTATAARAKRPPRRALRLDPAPLSRVSRDPSGYLRAEGYAGHHMWTDAQGHLRLSPYMAWHPETDVVRLMGRQPGAGELRVWDPVEHRLLPFRA